MSRRATFSRRYGVNCGREKSAKAFRVFNFSYKEAVDVALTFCLRRCHRQQTKYFKPTPQAAAELDHGNIFEK